MPTVEIYEHATLRGGAPVMAFPLETKQTVTSGSSTTHLSAAFDSGTTYITAISTAAFRFAIGSTATTALSTSATPGSHIYWPAEFPLNAAVLPGHRFLALSTTST